MAELVASRSRQTLADLVFKNKAAKEKVEIGVNGLVLVLSWIEEMLNDSDIMKEVKNMKDMKDFIYSIEDYLENWAVKVEAEYYMRKRGIKRILGRWFGRHDDGTDSIRRGIDFVAELRGWYDNDLPKLWFPAAEESEDLKNLIDLVKSKRVVSICGVRGMGKTSLATNVYYHAKVRARFEAFASVSFTQHREISSLLQNILNQLVGKKVKKSVIDSDKEEEEEGAETVKKSANVEQRKGIRLLRRRKPAYQGKKKRAEAVKKRANQENTKEEEEEKENGTEAVKKSTYVEKRKGLRLWREEKSTDQKDREEKSADQKDQLIKELKEIQGSKKCFIVIDNIWETSCWTEISSAFDCKETRILLTTPHTTTIPDAVSYEEKKADMVFYKLKPLDEEEGWKLLQKHAFLGERAPEKGIVQKLGKEMVQQCGGHPLKISRLGKILSKMPLNEWYMVNNNVKHYLQRDDNNTQSNKKSDGVRVSIYDELAYHKKQCFLFLAIFKGNEDVDSKDLKLLWMAEGMVPPTMSKAEHPQSMMDIAEIYMQELADNLAANGRFKPLHLHNYVRELSLSYGVREGFLLKVLNFSDNQQHTSCPSSKVRRLAIHFNNLSSSLNFSLDGLRLLRSLFFINSDQGYTVLPVRISDFKEIKLLRVLHFLRCKFDGRKLPQGIDALYNLRYLGVLYCDLDELPASLRNIRNLQILNVRVYGNAKITIPNDVYKMARLKHLCLPDNLGGEQSTLARHRDNSVHEQSNKLKFDGLHDLESLDGFNADIHDVKSLSKLEKLQHLVAHASSNGSLKSIIEFVKAPRPPARVPFRSNLYVESKCNFTSQEGLGILQEVLMCPNLHSLTISMVPIDEFPNWGRPVSEDLTEIKLIGCKISKDPMEALGTFPNLQKLCLEYGAFVGKEMTIGNEGFPKLEYLELTCCPIEEWRVVEGAMEKLLAITVKRCLKLNLSTFASSVRKLQMVLVQRNNHEIHCKKSHIRSNDDENSSTVNSFLKKSRIRSDDSITHFESHYPSSYTRHDDAILFPESITTGFLTQAQRKFDPSSSGTSSAH